MSNSSSLEIVAVIVLLGVLAVGGRACSEFKCDDIKSNSNIETKFSWWSGCYVKLHERIIAPREKP